MIDLGPAAERMAGLVRTAPADALDNPTPCEGLSLGDLLDHVQLLSAAFTAAARKARSAIVGPPPRPGATPSRPRSMSWLARGETLTRGPV